MELCDKTTELPPEEDGTYTLPEDCLRPFKIDALRYRIDGNKIIVEQSRATPGKNTLTLRYISNALAKAEHLPETQPLLSAAFPFCSRPAWPLKSLGNPSSP